MFESMRAARSLSPLFLGIFFMFIGDALVIASAGIMLKESGHSELEIGLISAFFFLGAIFSGFFVPSIIGALSYVRAYAVFTALFGIAAMLHDLGSNLVYWAILRFILGFCYYALLMIIESWINSKITNAIRSRVLAIYEAVFYGAFAIGVIILALNFGTMKVFVLSAFFIILALLPVNLIRFNPPRVPARMRISMPQISIVPPLAFATVVCAGILINGFFSMASVFVLSAGFGVGSVGAFMGSAMVGGFLSQLICGVISDKFGRKRAIMIVCAIGIVACAALFFAKSFILTCALALMLGFGAFPLYSLAIARANDSITGEGASRVQISAAMLFIYSSASLCSPLIIGAMMKFLGANGFIWVFFAAMSFLFIFAIFRPEIAPKR